MNYLCLYRTLVAAPSDPEAGTTLHESSVRIWPSSDLGAGINFHKCSGRIWAFHKRNATSRNAIVYYRNTKNEKKSQWSNIATLNLKLNLMKIIVLYLLFCIVSTIQKLLYEQKIISNILQL